VLASFEYELCFERLATAGRPLSKDIASSLIPFLTPSLRLQKAAGFFYLYCMEEDKLYLILLWSKQLRLN